MYGELVTMEKSCAINIQQLSAQVIGNLTKILLISKSGYSDSEYVVLQHAVGSLLGEIQIKILEQIYAIYPDLDDLKPK
jgi:hypothetical protein